MIRDPGGRIVGARFPIGPAQPARCLIGLPGFRRANPGGTRKALCPNAYHHRSGRGMAARWYRIGRRITSEEARLAVSRMNKGA